MITAAVTNAQLAEWRRTGHPYKVIASVIATWALEQERGTALPGYDYFAGDLDIVASASTWKRAKVFLRTVGVLRGNGPFEVA